MRPALISFEYGNLRSQTRNASINAQAKVIAVPSVPKIKAHIGAAEIKITAPTAIAKRPPIIIRGIPPAEIAFVDSFSVYHVMANLSSTYKIVATLLQLRTTITDINVFSHSSCLTIVYLSSYFTESGYDVAYTLTRVIKRYAYGCRANKIFAEQTHFGTTFDERC